MYLLEVKYYLQTLEERTTGESVPHPTLKRSVPASIAAHAGEAGGRNVVTILKLLMVISPLTMLASGEISVTLSVSATRTIPLVIFDNPERSILT